MLVNTHDNLHQRTLARTITANQRQNLTLVQIKADTFKNSVHAERFVYVLNIQKRFLRQSNPSFNKCSNQKIMFVYTIRQITPFVNRKSC